MSLRIPASIPPQVSLPDHIQNVGLLNRSLPSEEEASKVLNVVEGVITGEGIHEDRQGSAACMAGLFTELNNQKLLTPVMLNEVEANGTGRGAMPLPMRWAEVDRLCKENNTDGLLVLEVFDTDQSGTVTTSALGSIRDIAAGGTVRPPSVPRNSRVLVKVSWRFYDAKYKTVIDEVQMNDYFGVRSQGNVILDLGEFAKRDAIQQSGYVAGRSYPNRFLPGRIWLQREFYQRKGDQMKRATRAVEVNNWDKATAIWEPMTRDPKNKIAGRACYNMAIAAEVAGDIPKAVEWADKSYADFGDKRGRGYARVLRGRL